MNTQIIREHPVIIVAATVLVLLLVALAMFDISAGLVSYPSALVTDSVLTIAGYLNLL